MTHSLERWRLRTAVESDVPALEILIPLSVHVLQAPYYSTAQRQAALGPVFGVDRQLIHDQTYFVVEDQQQIVACGGWSRRKSFFGGNDGQFADAPLDPARDAARIRAFFVHPEWSRRGFGRRLLWACEEAIHTAGFRKIELVATLAGEPLYAAHAYAVVNRYEIRLSGDLFLAVVRMGKSIERGGSRA